MAVSRKSSRTAKRGERGIALLTALIITLVVFLLVTSILYMVTQSTLLGGAGKRYTTAADAADGAIEVTKDAVVQSLGYSQPDSAIPLTPTSGVSFSSALIGGGAATFTMSLPGTGLLQYYNAKVTVERLFGATLPGNRKEFPPQTTSRSSTALYFRITTVVTGPNNSSAQSTVVYRYTG